MITALLAVLAINMGCSDLTTQNKSNELNQTCSKSYEMGLHEYIMYEYFSNYNTEHYVQTFIDHIDMIATGENVYMESVFEFYLENINLFADIELFDSIVKEARSIYGVSDDVEIKNAFSKHTIEKYTRISIFEKENLIKTHYRNNASSRISENDLNHYISLQDLVGNKASKMQIINFLEETKRDESFSLFYKDVLDFSLNAFKFYNEEFTDMVPDVITSDINAFVIQYHADKMYCKKCSQIPFVAYLTHEQHEQKAWGEALIASAAGFGSSIVNEIQLELKLALQLLGYQLTWLVIPE